MGLAVWIGTMPVRCVCLAPTHGPQGRNSTMSADTVVVRAEGHDAA